MSTLLEFPRARVQMAPDHIHAVWTFVAFDAVMREVAPHWDMSIRLAAFDKFAVAIEASMRMAAEQASRDAAKTMQDHAWAGDLMDWLCEPDDGSPAVSKAVPHE